MFKPKQKLVFVRNASSHPRYIENPDNPMPIHGKIYTFSSYYPGESSYLKLEEFGDDMSFLSLFFKPVEPVKSAIKELVNIKIITETSDAPMKNPSPMQPLKELELV